MSDTEQKEMRVAVASKDRQQINEHFGHADAFHVYQLGPAGVVYLEERQVEHYCQGGYGDEDKREVILRALADCSALFVARIGEGPRERLERAGIQAVDDYPYAQVDTALQNWYQDRGRA
ncbi:NifB/NifX family molybdenum-iron cluster-binding protein [Azovibrio restrictus]|uniref:NifB/NifX family molybdenum-iron cluster-binding protein n=1 Tax=Azovibrio restrictus TaxID=146938 RepID=UPI00040BB1E9|nr:NifB/NifX family molybdenum-iron cluster-binding protein [Azovibrio restrictus]MCE1172520.1 dinitrogenase iron-molybdenum cofactor biosynthesis protein [Azovibrio sp.]